MRTVAPPRSAQRTRQRGRVARPGEPAPQQPGHGRPRADGPVRGDQGERRRQVGRGGQGPPVGRPESDPVERQPFEGGEPRRVGEGPGHRRRVPVPRGVVRVDVEPTQSEGRRAAGQACDNTRVRGDDGPQPAEVRRGEQLAGHPPADRPNQPEVGVAGQRRPVRRRFARTGPAPEDRVEDRLAGGAQRFAFVDVIGRVRHQRGEEAPLEVHPVLVERPPLVRGVLGRRPVADQLGRPCLGEGVEQLRLPAAEGVGGDASQFALHPDELGPYPVAGVVQEVGERQPGEVVVRVGFNRRDECRPAAHTAPVGKPRKRSASRSASAPRRVQAGSIRSTTRSAGR